MYSTASLHPTGANARLSLIHPGVTQTVTPHRLPTDYCPILLRLRPGRKRNYSSWYHAMSGVTRSQAPEASRAKQHVHETDATSDRNTAASREFQATCIRARCIPDLLIGP